MGSYIILFRFTQQGIQNVKDSPARIEAAKEGRCYCHQEVT